MTCGIQGRVLHEDTSVCFSIMLMMMDKDRLKCTFHFTQGRIEFFFQGLYLPLKVSITFKSK